MTAVKQNPYGTPRGERYALTAKVDRADVERITAAAEAAGVTRSRWVAEALARVLATTPEVGLATPPSTSAAGEARVNVEPQKAA